MASAVFPGETASGWQSVRFATPVDVTAGITYIASYHTTTGNYAADINGLYHDGVDKPPLHIPAGGGLYRYGARDFPNAAANHNFWVDVYFEPEGS
jgi:hypothetical protein